MEVTVPIAPPRNSSRRLPPKSQTEPTQKNLENFEQYKAHELVSEATYLSEHSKNDLLNQRVCAVKEIVKNYERYELAERISAVKDIASHSENYDLEQHVYAIESIAAHSENYEAAQHIYAAKQVVEHSKNHEMWLGVFAARIIVKYGQNFTAIEHEYAAKHVLGNPKSYTVQEYGRAVRYVLKNPQSYSSRQYLYAVKHILDNPQSYTLEEKAYASSIKQYRERLESEEKKERAHVHLAKQIIEYPENHAVGTYVYAVKHIMGHPECYTPKEYALAIKHITENKSRYTLSEWAYACEVQKLVEHPESCDVIGNTYVGALTHIITHSENYDSSVCRLAVRHILGNPTSYKVQEFALATKYVINYPHICNEKELNFVLKKIINYYDQHNQQVPLYDEKDINKTAQLFLRYNTDFFQAPLAIEKQKREKFKSLFEQEGRLAAIQDYSAKLHAVLSDTYYSERKDIADLVKGRYEFRTSRGMWADKKFEEVLALETNVSLFILRNMKHEAITFWNSVKK